MARTKSIGWAYAAAYVLSVGFSLPLFCAVAHAQGVVANAQGGIASSGPAGAEAMSPLGFRVGNLEIHPEFASKIGYDSNVFRADGKGAGGQSKIDSAGLFTATPGITITTLGRLRRQDGVMPSAPPKLELRVAGYATFFQYIGLYNPVTKKEENRRGAEFDVSGDFLILPKRPFSALLGASWSRNARPFTASAGEEDKKDQRKSQAFNVIVPRARLMFESRGGVLTAYTGFRPSWNPFEGKAFKYLSAVSYDVDAGVGWKFFPSTALLSDVTFTYVDYYRFEKEDNSRVQVLVSNSKRVRARLGVNGAFTKHLSLRILGGYAVGVFDQPWLDEYEAPVGEAVLNYRFGQDSVAEGGYVRNVNPAAVGGFQLSDRGYARLKFVLLKLFAMTAEAGVAHVEYGRQIAPIFANPTSHEIVGTQALGTQVKDGVRTFTEDRTDLRIDAMVRAEYRVVSWLGLLADFIYQRNKTDFDFGSTLTPDPADYQVFQVNAGLRASY